MLSKIHGNMKLILQTLKLKYENYTRRNSKIPRRE